MREPFYSGGRWIYRVKNDDGREKTFTSVKEGMAGKRAVMKKAKSWLEGTYKRSGYRVSDYWISFLKYYEDIHGGKNEAYHLYSSLGRIYILPELGKIKIDDLRYKTLQNFLLNMKLKYGDIPARDTLRSVRTTINQFVRYLVIVEEVMMPFALPLQISPKAIQRKEKIILQPDDIKSLFAKSNEDSPYVFAYQFCLTTGLRTGELIGLKWSDVDWNKNSVTISRSINSRGKQTACKNQNARRTFVLNKISRRVIEKQKEWLESKEIESIWIFPDEFGRLTTHQRLNREYKRLPLPGTVYSLRHSFVSLTKYVNLASVKRTIGHSESMRTLEVYSHSIDGEMENDAAIIGEELNRRLGI